VGLLTLDWERHQTTGDGGLGQPAVVPSGGGIPAALCLWEPVRWHQRSTGKLRAVAACSNSAPQQRIARRSAALGLVTALRMQGSGGGGTTARAHGLRHPPFMGAGGGRRVARMPRKAAAHNRGGCHGLWLTDGPSRATGWAGAGWVGPTSSAQEERDGFLFIFRIYF
jgi:hypothetical protein